MGDSEVVSDDVVSDALLSVSLSEPQAARLMDAVSASAAMPRVRVRSKVFMVVPFGEVPVEWAGARCREVFVAVPEADG
jgi:hypothetical protein